MLWENKYTQKGIIFSLIVVGVHLLLFPNYIMSVPILLIGLVIILFFYLAFKFYSENWMQIENFSSKLFIHSFVFRSLSIVGMYALTYIYQPENLPLEIGASDAWNYHSSGQLVANTLKNDGDIFRALTGFWKNETDYGFSIYVGIIYYFIGPSVLVIKVCNAIIGSFTAVRIYQIGKEVYSEKKARLAGILAMIFPTLLWFTAMLLKETILIFLLVNIAYYIISLTNKPQKGLIYAVLILLNLLPLYYFRVFLIPLVVISIAFHALFYQAKSMQNKLIIRVVSIFVFLIISLLANQLGMVDNFIKTADQASSAFSSELAASAMQRGLNYKVALVTPFLLISAIITPFPSLIHFDDNQLGIYMHFQNELVRNFMYFFVFLGVYHIIKNRKRQAAYILVFCIGYILILAISGVSFQDRFQVLALPFLILFIPEGLERYSLKKSNNLNIYLFFIFIAILSWNLFKLSLRQLL